MTVATVIELPQRLEAVTHDPFIDDEVADLVASGPRAVDAPAGAAPGRRRVFD